MKKVININFQGRVLPIEERAYESLQRYIDSLRRHFLEEDGREEIINDIESRIAELFDARLRNGASCITEDDLEAVIRSIGRPEDFGGEEEQVRTRLEEEATGNAAGYTAPNYDAQGRRRFFRSEDDKVVAGVCGGIAAYFGIDVMVVRLALLLATIAGFGFGLVLYLLLWAITPSTASQTIGAPRRRLMRDPEEKILGGVCRGLSWYFGVNVWVPRLLFLLPCLPVMFVWPFYALAGVPEVLAFVFSPAVIIVYIVLWLALPEALTASDRLQMRGEPVNLDSIRANFTAEMRGVDERIKRFGRDAGRFAQERGEALHRSMTDSGRRQRSGLGGAFGLLLKVVVYFILGILLFALVCALFTFGVAGAGLMPLRRFVLEGSWQEALAWGTLVLFVWVPVVAITAGIIRRLAKAKRNRFLSATFASLWGLGIACLVLLIVSLYGNFNYHNEPAEERISLRPVDKLLLTTNTGDEYFRPRRWLRFEPFALLNTDTLLINSVQLRVVKSPNDSFQIRLVRSSEGASSAEAARLAAAIRYTPYQQDSLLVLPKGIPITRGEKYRNQLVYLTVMVPVGKRIEVSRSSYETPGFVYHGDDYYSHRRFIDDWDYDTEYIMLADGLHEVSELEAGAGNAADIGNLPADSLQKIAVLRERQKAQEAARRRQRSEEYRRQADSLDALDE